MQVLFKYTVVEVGLSVLEKNDFVPKSIAS